MASALESSQFIFFKPNFPHWLDMLHVIRYWHGLPNQLIPGRLKIWKEGKVHLQTQPEFKILLLFWTTPSCVQGLLIPGSGYLLLYYCVIPPQCHMLMSPGWWDPQTAERVLSLVFKELPWGGERDVSRKEILQNGCRAAGKRLLSLEAMRKKKAHKKSN